MKLKLTEILKPMLSMLPALVAVGFLAVSVMIYNKIMDANDSVVEEVVEDALEQEAEAVFFLEDGKLKGKIDLSPGTPDKEA